MVFASRIHNLKVKSPERDAHYLIYYHWDDDICGWVVGEYEKDKGLFYSDFIGDYVDNVTHWCELPSNPI